MDHVLQRMREANELVQRAGPYVLLEILLPGGTLFALALFLYRRRIGFAWMRRRLADALHLRVVATRGNCAERDGLEPLGLGVECRG